MVFLDNLGFAIVVPYLYFYVEALGGSALTYGVLLASYSLASFVFTPLVARLSDRYGRRKILLAALAVSSFSYFLFGVSELLWLLFLSRMLAGTTAATVPVAQAYVADVTTKNQRLQYLGLLGAAAGLAFIFGPALGGTLSSLFGMASPLFGVGVGILQFSLSIFPTARTQSLQPQTYRRPLQSAPKYPASALNYFAVCGLFLVFCGVCVYAVVAFALAAGGVWVWFL